MVGATLVVIDVWDNEVRGYPAVGGECGDGGGV